MAFRAKAFLDIAALARHSTTVQSRSASRPLMPFTSDCAQPQFHGQLQKLVLVLSTQSCLIPIAWTLAAYHYQAAIRASAIFLFRAKLTGTHGGDGSTCEWHIIG